ncbi:MAG: hypothetical protein Q9M14_05200 [Mariprofundaceae bacterium]|nr:hypothetical protein [Mariprofundaceae bacterium]
MNTSVLKRLRELQNNITVPASKFSTPILRSLAPLFDTGVLSKEAYRGGAIIRLNIPEVVEDFILNNFPSEGNSHLIAESNRAQSILVSRDSKKGDSSQTPFVVMRGFGNCMLHHANRTFDAAFLTDLSGVCAIKVDRDNFWSFEGSVALVENLEVFWDIEKIMDVDLAIYLAGRISNKIIDWFASNDMKKARLIHLGDYDPVGLDEFLRIYGACGERVELYIPENIEYLFSSFGNAPLIRDKRKNQELLSKLRLTNNKDVLSILRLIDKYGCIVEHEILLACSS